MMTIIRRTPAGSMAYVKGAPDVLLARCTHRLRPDGHVEALNDRHREEILADQRIAGTAGSSRPRRGASSSGDASGRIAGRDG